MPTMWMIRGEGGRLYDDFRDREVAAIGWPQLAPFVLPGISRKELQEKYREIDPSSTMGRIISGASQVWRFVNEIAVGDRVVTYSPANRTYLLGTVTGEFRYQPEWADDDMPMTRAVSWEPQEVDRDSLVQASKNSLGSTLTLFRVPDSAAQDLLSGLDPKRKSVAHVDTTEETDEADPLDGVESMAIERIKDLVSGLAWDEMQELVAGILRAMGYKTQVSPAGPDRGKDIVASPDGFGFENPRIVVEVKHRKGQMGADAVRSFLGGRHKDDRGLYVSTGGFSKDAYYEADRAAVPLTLWTLDNLVRALVEHYDSTDTETKRLVPLKRLYVPA